VKVPAAGVPASAAGLAAVAAAAGVAGGVITGKMLATLTGLMSDVLETGAAGMDPIAGCEASAAGVTEDT
jgi:hypothetical protein